jgi:predicted aminopeptidase
MKKIHRIVSISALLYLCSGCAQLAYYSQAVQGQMAVVAQAKPIERVLAQNDTDDKLHARLELVQEIRRFAITELGLPENGSYKKYADLKRPYVLWNVVVTPVITNT